MSRPVTNDHPAERDDPSMSAAPRSGGPLAGVRVIDLTQMLSGPYSTMVLADLGADVVKIEPLTGDATRFQGPHLPDDQLHAYGGYFNSVNRNKRSLAVDLKSEMGRDLLRTLVRDADVLVENFRAGVMDRLGLSYESLRAENPRLVYTAIRGFGDPRTGASPYTDWPAFDVVAQAMGGLMGITGPGPGQPTKTGPGIGDLFPALHAAVGTLAALRSAMVTGEGQFVDVAMYDSIVSLCERAVYQYSYGGVIAQPQGNTHPLLCPFDVFPSKDGHITIAAPRDNHWQLLCTAMGRPELGTDPRYATNMTRLQNAVEVRRLLSDWTTTLTNDEIVAALAGQVPVGPVNTARDIAEDPHIAARNMLVEVEHAGSSRTVTLAGNAIKLTGTPPPDMVRAPVLNEHADAVLAEAGLTADRIAELRAAGAIN